MVLNHQVELADVLSCCSTSHGGQTEWKAAHACPVRLQIARLVLMEQLYRGYTILRGEQYHH
jgi:Predicted SPOUT methyltransferase